MNCFYLYEPDFVNSLQKILNLDFIVTEARIYMEESLCGFPWQYSKNYSLNIQLHSTKI